MWLVASVLDSAGLERNPAITSFSPLQSKLTCPVF